MRLRAHLFLSCFQAAFPKTEAKFYLAEPGWHPRSRREPIAARAWEELLLTPCEWEIISVV
jgi:hypothetical protein